MKKHMTFTLRNRISAATLMALSHRLKEEKRDVTFTLEQTSINADDTLSLISFFLVAPMNSTISLTCDEEDAEQVLYYVTQTILEENRPMANTSA
ncbi:HPr family phosphocarrier protein [Aureibacillus halotolerans]|uniref:Phosphotransferase system HPr-like phosphotransfer protein n=1 Tax=Aureibacillus halotolerans TaxID=1508390 RepID=A0A4V3D612_9BACI|nr:HPr family phosphocarrier protein [Aureibacillus halotolerans]TDQ42237.1 hypothetical protein EV213_102268 [Aureibacillus halotolerans]